MISSTCLLLSFAGRLHLQTPLPTPSINTNAKQTPLLDLVVWVAARRGPWCDADSLATESCCVGVWRWIDKRSGSIGEDGEEVLLHRCAAVWPSPPPSVCRRGCCLGAALSATSVCVCGGGEAREEFFFFSPPRPLPAPV
uniref:Secreted protein n=1 Tax=Ixodes ricinus TaxID=34613 RepID=A0A6B0UT32_IXORI